MSDIGSHIAEQCRLQQHYLNMLRISACDFPHGVVRCQSRTPSMLADNLTNVQKQLEDFISQHSSSTEIEKIFRRSVERPLWKEEIEKLDSETAELLSKFHEDRTRLLYVYTGEGKYVC
jgi:hypothetical protein